MRNMGAHEREVCGSILPAGVGERFVDLHCHCLPNLDDGPGSISEALMLCRALVEDNIGSVVATPHQLGRFEAGTDARKIRQRVRDLNGELAAHNIDLKVLPGAEVRLDERLGELLVEQEILTLADVGRHILLELPEAVFIDIEPLVAELRDRGVKVIIAHPERSAPLLAQREALQRWLDSGVALQVTAASLTGRFGPQAARAAWQLIAKGAAGIVATDAHDPYGHGPCMTAAFQMISTHLGAALARHLCIENPARVVKGESLSPVFLPEQQEIS